MKSGMTVILPARPDRSRFFWFILVAGLALATLLPIGIHTVMLDDMGIPYPSALPRVGWAATPDHALLVFGVLCLDAALLREGALSTIGRIGFVFVAVSAINQALFRMPIMRNVVSTKWTIYPFVDNGPEVLRFAAIVMIVCATGPIVTTTARRVAAAILAALLAFNIIGPVLDGIFAPFIAANAKHEGDQLYNIPYDWHVDVPSYLTYIEPALGAFAVAMILTRLRVRWPIIAAMVFALQGGPLFRLVLNPFYAPSSLWLAVLSEGQFALEAAALAILVATISTVLLRPAIDQGT